MDAPARNPLPQALDPALALIAREKLTGFLVATRGSVQKRLAIEDGAIVFAASNDRKDLIGQALLRSGLISESDLIEALRTEAATTPNLRAALTAMRKVTPEQCEKVFQSKMRECVLDIFLWPSGSLQITRASLGKADMPFPLLMEVGALRTEGARRRARWKVVARILPNNAISFVRNGEWPQGFPSTQGDKMLASLVDSGRTLGQILLDLHGAEYAVKVRLSNLVERKILSVSTVTRPGSGLFPIPPISQPEGVIPGVGEVSDLPGGEFTTFGPPPADPLEEAAPEQRAETQSDDILSQAQKLLDSKELEKARQLLEELIQENPLSSPEAWELLQKIEAETLASAEARGLSDTVVLSLAIPVNTLAGRTFPPAESFLVSRFAAGPNTIGAIKAVCPFPPHELVVLLGRLLDQGVLRRRR